jgi:type IV secretory pathway ATPase VirB11/archaellum biosynthesis ATPase
MLGPFTGSDDAGGDCRCRSSFTDDRLVVRSDDCPGAGELAASPACRATVVEALTERDVAAVVTRYRGRERVYEDGGAALLVAAGRFVDRAGFHDERLADRTARDPLGGAREATGRAGPLASLAAETGLAEAASQGTYESVLRPCVGPSLARSRVAARPPPDACLVDATDLDTGATVRRYDHPDGVRRYHLTPLEATLDDDALATLAAAHERLAHGSAEGERAPGRAVRCVAAEDEPVAELTRVLRKHTRGWGVLVDLFADPAVSDVFATAPVAETRLRVRADGEPLETNVRLTGAGASALASRFRRESGRAFSRATPTLAAATTVGDRRVRAAGITEPVSDGLAFAFRAHDDHAWSLAELVANGTLTARTAALLSLAVERGAALLVTGARGAGKTTLLGALLGAVPEATRTLVVEDTPELPVQRLQERGRDVQRLRVSAGDGPGLAAAEALRTALRLGEGALVVGEVRGEEAGVLYEAMRVGAADGAVLGTIHGDGGSGVRERVVEDLGVPARSFAATDAVVTVRLPERDADGSRERTVTVEEVLEGPDGAAFATLAGPDADDRLGRGESRLLESLTRPGECYADVVDVLGAERGRFETGTVGSVDDRPSGRAG